MTTPTPPPPPPPPAYTPPPPPPPAGAPVPAGPSGYPAELTVETPAKIANWRPLVQWLMAIPHLVIAGVLNYVAEVCAFIAWLAILFTGRMPAGLANFIAMIFRYNTRAYAYAGFLHDTYPPFGFDTTAADPGGHPVRVDFRPALENRNRLTVGLRIIWVIPALLLTLLVMIVAWVCWLIGFFAVLFTGKWPEGLRQWVVKGLRASTRLSAYFFLLTDEYPPNPFN